MSEQFVKATELHEANRKLEAANARLRELGQERSEIETTARENAERDLLAQLTREFSGIPGYDIEAGERGGLTHLTLPGNGGKVQVALIGPGSPHAGQIAIRVWGPPGNGYGVHEQGGGNLEDFSATFALTSEGIDLAWLDIRKRRAD